jgi:hypothetical protein
VSGPQRVGGGLASCLNRQSNPLSLLSHLALQLQSRFQLPAYSSPPSNFFFYPFHHQGCSILGERNGTDCVASVFCQLFVAMFHRLRQKASTVFRPKKAADDASSSDSRTDSRLPELAIPPAKNDPNPYKRDISSLVHARDVTNPGDPIKAVGIATTENDPSIAMASSSLSLARSYYGPINPSILGGFDDLPEEEDLIDLSDDNSAPRTATTTTTTSTTTSIAQTETSISPSSKPAFHYRPTNPAIFGGFGDSDEDEESPEPPTAPRRTPPAQNGRHSPPVSPPASRPSGYLPVAASILVGWDSDEESTDRTSPVQDPKIASSTSNNPYSSAIESKQNAMTVAFLRSQDFEPLLGVELPAYPSDDHG